MIFESFGFIGRQLAYNSYRPESLLTDSAWSFAIGATTQGVILANTYRRSVLNHCEGAMTVDRKKFKSMSKRVFFENDPVVWMRGGVFGLIQLTFYDQYVRKFSDDYGLAVKADSGKQMTKFIGDEGDFVSHLHSIGYFSRSPLEMETKKTVNSFSILSGSVTTAFILSLVMSPLDYLCLRRKAADIAKKSKSAYNLPSFEILSQTPSTKMLFMELRSFSVLAIFFSTFVKHFLSLTAIHALMK